MGKETLEKMGGKKKRGKTKTGGWKKASPSKMLGKNSLRKAKSFLGWAAFVAGLAIALLGAVSILEPWTPEQEVAGAIVEVQPSGSAGDDAAQWTVNLEDGQTVVFRQAADPDAAPGVKVVMQERRSQVLGRTKHRFARLVDGPAPGAATE